MASQDQSNKDPWQDSLPSGEATSSTFEDNFLGDKLPDSEEYLTKLESRLRGLQNKSSVLQQLKDRREHCIEALLASEGPLEQRISDLELDQPISGAAGSGSGQQLLRLINPEQPLTIGEVLHLVKHDELERTEEDDAVGQETEAEKPVDESSSSKTSTPPPSR